MIHLKKNCLLNFCGTYTFVYCLTFLLIFDFSVYNTAIPIDENVETLSIPIDLYTTFRFNRPELKKYILIL